MIKFGIIGFGIFGEKRLIPGFQGSRGTIQAITKRNVEEAKQKAIQYSIPTYFDDPESMIKDAGIDAVYIASPNKNHLEHVKIAAEYGKDIICEKPMATTIAEAIEMSQICNKHGIRFMIAHCYRYMGSCLKIKDILNSGMLGDVEFINAHYSFPAETSPRTWVFNKVLAGGGPIFDIGVHMVDLIRFLLQDNELLAFKGFSKSFDAIKYPERDVEASGSLLMQFSEGVQASVTCSFEMPYLTEITVHGTKKTLHSRYFTIVDKDADIFIFSDNDFKNPEQSITINNGNFYRNMIDAFSKVMETGDIANSIPGLKDGIMNQIILNYWNKETSKDIIDSIKEKA